MNLDQFKTYADKWSFDDEFNSGELWLYFNDRADYLKTLEMMDLHKNPELHGVRAFKSPCPEQLNWTIHIGRPWTSYFTRHEFAKRASEILDALGVSYLQVGYFGPGAIIITTTKDWNAETLTQYIEKMRASCNGVKAPVKFTDHHLNNEATSYISMEMQK